MKVLFANKYFYVKGGSERILFQERDFLLNAGIDVADFSMRDAMNSPSPCQCYFIKEIDYRAKAGFIDRIKTAVSFVRSKEAITRLGELIDKEKPDIAHLHNIYHQITPSIIPFLKKRGIKVVLTLHDWKLICPSYIMLSREFTVCSKCEGRKFYKTVQSHCCGSRMHEVLLAAEGYYHRLNGSYDCVDMYIAASHFLSDLMRKHRLGSHPMTVLHNGIDTDEYAPHYADDGYALFLGRLSREKGVETLLRAYDSLGVVHPLKILGTGPLENELKAKYRNVEFLGYKTGDELRETVERAAFVVIPSEWYENCPLAVLEAMALGKPVIGARIGGIPEQIEDGVHGLLFESGDAGELGAKMLMLWNNPDMRSQMGLNARKRVEDEFSLATHCRKLLAIYEQVLSR